MDEAVYKIVELTGTSKTSTEAAIQNAISRASKTIRNLRWFEIIENRGYIENGRVSYWQVSLKAGFNVEEISQKKEDKGQGEEKQQETTQKKEVIKYRCKVCGYVYDPEKGDPSQDIKPGTPFEELADSWKCPECGVGKEQFEKMG